MIKTGFYDKCVLRAARAILFHLTACSTLEYILTACRTFAYIPPHEHTQLTGTPLSLSHACRVTQLEAERLEETREDREAFRRMLLAEVERQAREKNVHIKLPDGRQL